MVFAAFLNRCSSERTEAISLRSGAVQSAWSCWVFDIVVVSLLLGEVVKLVYDGLRFAVREQLA
jgi:hypothetical protein